MSACEELVGSPKYHVMMSQRIAPSRPAKTTENVTTLTSIIPLPMVVATAVWVRRTVPMVMVWMGVFVLMRLLAGWLVDGLKTDEHWRLIDLWNDLYLCGLWCLGADPATIRPQPQPDFWQAAVVVAAVCMACLVYLRRRVQAVEIVS